MPDLNIKNGEAHRLARRLAKITGETLTDAVTQALRERLEREKRLRRRAGIAKRLVDIGQKCAALPVRDARSPEEILGYDEHGLPR